MTSSAVTAETEILAFATGGGRDVLLVGPKLMTVDPFGTGVTARLLTSANGVQVSEQEVSAVMPVPVALSSSALFYATRTANGIVSYLLKIDGGAPTQLYDDFSPWSATIQGDTLALIGVSCQNRQELRLASITGPSERKVFELPAGTLAGPMAHLISLTPGPIVTLADVSEASFVPLDISSGTLRVGYKKALSGSEIARSRDWPSGAWGSSMKQMKRIFIVGLQAKADGGVRALLAPYRHEDGYRSVEYDSNGNEQAVLRLATPNSTSANAGVRPTTVVWSDSQIVVMAPGGVRRSYGATAQLPAQ